jgi:hypothetical protein
MPAAGFGSFVNPTFGKAASERQQHDEMPATHQASAVLVHGIP